MTMPKFEPVAWRYDLTAGEYTFAEKRYLNETYAPRPTALYTADQLAEAYEAGKLEQAAQIEMLKAQMLRIIGEHYAPNDCYSTGPLHGDFRDHSCPSCEGLEMLSAIQDQALEQFAAKVREQCAQLCLDLQGKMVSGGSSINYWKRNAAPKDCAEAIRNLNELPK